MVRLQQQQAGAQRSAGPSPRRVAKKRMPTKHKKPHYQPYYQVHIVRCLARFQGTGWRAGLQERNMYSWSTSTWRRRLLLPADNRHAGKPLTSALMAVSGVGAAAFMS